MNPHYNLKIDNEKNEVWLKEAQIKLFWEGKRNNGEQPQLLIGDKESSQNIFKIISYLLFHKNKTSKQVLTDRRRVDWRVATEICFFLCITLIR